MVHHVMIAMEENVPNVRRFKTWCDVQSRTWTVVRGHRVDSIQDMKPYLTPYGLYNIQRRRETSMHFDRSGPVGCFLSHRSVWQMCVDRQEDMWVFEEGVTEYQSRQFQKLDEREDHLDLILGHTICVLRFIRQCSVGGSVVGTGVNSIDKIYFGTKCYRISPRFARHLLDSSEQFDMHVDSFICVMAMATDSMRTARTVQNIVTAASSGKINHTLDAGLVVNLYMTGIIVVFLFLISGMILLRKRGGRVAL